MKNINPGCLEGATGWSHVSEFDEASNCFHRSALPFSDFIQVGGSPSAVCREESVLWVKALFWELSVLGHLHHSPPLQGSSPVPILQTTRQRLRMAEWLSQSYTVSS